MKNHLNLDKKYISKKYNYNIKQVLMVTLNTLKFLIFWDGFLSNLLKKSNNAFLKFL